MTNIHDLVARLHSLDVKIWDDEGYLGLDAPDGVLDDALMEELRAHKGELLTFLQQGVDAVAHRGLGRREPGIRVPVSPSQRGLWSLSQLDGGSVAYNVPFVTELRGTLDGEALERAIASLVDRHSSLRTTFHDGEGGPLQRIAESSRVVLERVDLRAVDVEAVESAVEERLAEWVHTPFDLEVGPLLRAGLIRRAERSHVLALVVHHMVCDGFSLAILARELEALYAAFREGRPSPLPELPLEFADYSVWHAKRLEEGSERHLAYWERTLEGMPSMRLPGDRPRPSGASFRGAHLIHHIDRGLTDSLRGLSKSAEASLYATLFAAFQVLVARLTGQEDFAVASGSLGRNHPSLEGIVGHFFNIAMIRSEFADNPSFATLVSRVRAAMLISAEHEDLPFEQVARHLRPERVAGENPFTQVALSLEKFSSAGLSLAGLKATRRELSFRIAKLDVAFWISEFDDRLEIAVEYNSDLFDESSVVRLTERYERILRAVVRDPSLSIGSLDLLSEEERAALMGPWSGSEEGSASTSEGGCVHWRFERYAARDPGALAVVDVATDRRMTYGELDQQAEAIAAHLRSRGLAASELVGVCLGRSCELVAAILGVMKAGGAFVILDPELPRKRLAFHLEDAGLSLIVTDEASCLSLPESDAQRVDVAAALAEASARGAERERLASPEQLAYVLYTSGSTGSPNGVLIEHRGLDNAIEAHIQLMETGPGSRHAHLLSLSFDGGLAHLFAMICAGGSVYLLPREGRYLAEGLVSTIDGEKLTHSCIPPTMLAALPDAALPSLETLVVAGERCPAALVERWGRGRRMLNLYGPTEASILATYARCVAEGRDPAIGRPIANMRAYILDRWGKLAPPGAVGELALAGVGVARGYLQRPELSARKFVANPFGEGLLYRTGDLARFRTSAGDPPPIDFCGRIDAQVKIRGHRVEVEEIEHALRGASGVGDAVVTVHPTTGAAADRLIAYVTSRRAEGAPRGFAEGLRVELEATLPTYLVPSSIVVLEALPRSASGKLDRRSLPLPELSAEEVVGPRNEVERALVEIWRDVLGIERFGVHDNFFALGGDSVLGIQVVARALEVEIPLRSGQLFEEQTIAELAAAAAIAAPLEEEEAFIVGPVPLTPIQEWFFAGPGAEEAEGEEPPAHLNHFNQAIMLEVPPHLNARILRRALRRLQLHHDALRLRFRGEVDEGGRRRWSQESQEAVRIAKIREVELGELGEEARRERIAEAAAELQGSLDIVAGPTMQAQLFRLGPDEPARVLWIIHHLVVDAVSWQILIADLSVILRALAAEEEPSLTAKTTSYKRWSERLRSLAAEGDFAAERAYLDHEPPRPLPLDHSAGANDRRESATVEVRLSAEETLALLRDALRPYGLGTQDLLLTALARAHRSWTGSSTLWVDHEGHGREGLFEGVDLSRTVGWFTSVHPLRIELPASEGPEAEIVAVKEQVRAVPRRGIGFGLLRYLHGDGEAQGWPQPEIAFNYVGQMRRDVDAALGLRLAAEDVGPLAATESPRRHLLEVNGLVDGDTLAMGFTFSRARHDEATIAGFAASFIDELRGLIKHCEGARERWSPADFPRISIADEELQEVVRRVGETGRSTIATIFPLTSLQKGMLYHALRAETASAYTTQIALTLEGEFDAETFDRAWGEVAGRHEALRSAFLWEGLSEPVQVVLQRAKLVVEQVHRPGAEEAQIEAFARELAERPVPLGEAPIMRMTVVQTGPQRRLLFWDSHHILMDGWSMSVLLRELLAGYRALRRGQGAPSFPRVAYEGYLRWSERQDRVAAADFWRESMVGVEAPTPLAIEQSVPAEERGLSLHDVHLPAELTSRLVRAAEAARVTPATVLAGVWGLVLSRYSGLDDVLFGTVASGRDVDVPGIEAMLGLFIHMLPVRVEIDDGAEIWEWLRSLQARQAAGRKHQITPLVEIQSFSGVPAGVALFRSVLVYQDYPFDASAFSDPDLEVGFRSASDPTHYPLVVTAIPGERLHLSIEFDQTSFAAASIARMAGHMEQLLRGILDPALSRVGELELTTPEERTQVLEGWNQTQREHARDRSLHAHIEAQALARPDAAALVAGPERLSYAQLNARANQLAHYLTAKGVGAETRVAVCVDRSQAMLVAILGVLKAGGAYVPVDPTYPFARQSWMIEDSGAAWVLTVRGLAGRLDVERSKVIAIDGDAAAIAAEGEGDPERPFAPENLAYIIYTSGSTGTPKGVAIEHRNAVAMLHAATEHYPAEDLRAVSAAASLCFDYSILELFVPLFVGGTVVLVDDGLALAELSSAEKVGLVSMVPSTMAELDRAGRLPSGARSMNLAGERLTRDLVQRAYAMPDIERVYNIYGPTETTTFSTYSLTSAEERGEPTLGRPIANTRVYILDRRMRPVPIGVPGELYIAGEGVSRGYWNRPKLTAERFLEDPFAPGRMYKTGDLGRYRADGEIEYLGRLDDQIKLRGFRVELGEIEAALAALPGVDQAAVTSDGAGSQQRLVAHWIPARGADAPTTAELREQLARRLPKFMVPEIYLQAEAFPRTGSGKIDRRALPSPEGEDLEKSDFRAPKTHVEQVLAEIWEDVLGVENVGVDDNFFRLGGHSLLALTMVLRVEAALSKTISIATLFAEPTLGDLARLLEGPEVPPAPTTSSRLILPFTRIAAAPPADGASPRPPILCVGGFGVHASYLHPIGAALGEEQPFYGIQPLDIDEPMPEVERMEQLASRLADLVQEVQPEGPYTLSGHSAGARLALGIASELEDRGHRTALVVLDMHAPVEGGADQDKWTSEEGLLDYIRQMKVVLGEALAVDIDATAQMSDEDAWAHIAAILEREQLLPEGGGVETLRRTVSLRERVFTLLADYVPVRRYPGRFVLLSVADRHRVGLPRIASEAWQEFCERPVEAHVVPGDHLSMIRDPHVEVVAGHLRRVVDETWLLPATPVDTIEPVTGDTNDFKVDWSNPEDAEALWLFDEAHCPEPMTPLDFELRLAPMAAATNRASKIFGLPLSSEPRLINAFVFQRAEIHEVPEDQRDAVWSAADNALRDAGQGLDRRWQEEWLPEIQGHIAALGEADVEGGDLPALLAHLVDLRDRIARLWEIHFELMYPVTLALSDYDDAYADLFEDEGALAAYELLAGSSSQTTDANIRLWELGREAAASPALRELVCSTAPEKLLEALDATAEGRAFRPKVDAYVAAYGERNDNMYIDRPTWIEDPIAILRGLREAVLQPDRDLGAELRLQETRRTERVAEVREAIAAHPRPVIDEFEALLAAAQASTHLSEEHNFWIDCKITYYARRLCLAIGRRLHSAGLIDGPEDVFYLSLDELRECGERPSAATLGAVIGERKATEERFTGVKPPPFMGTMKPFLPPDSALMRAMARANGGAVPPSEDPRVLRGSPGAAGRVRGPARIVRTLDEAGKLRPGDILVAAATLPSWTPYFAIASAVVTNSGGMLCHAAVVAREYGIPAVVGTRTATAMLRDGQIIEVDGDGGIVRIVDEGGAAT